MLGKHHTLTNSTRCLESIHLSRRSKGGVVLINESIFKPNKKKKERPPPPKALTLLVWTALLRHCQLVHYKANLTFELAIRVAEQIRLSLRACARSAALRKG
jgi:hypothetical protein